jgi:hypothetical protein
VDRRISLAAQQGGLDLAHEDAPAAHFPHGDVRAAVARGGDRDELDFQPGMERAQQ